MRRLDAAGDRGAALAEYAELRSRLVTRLAHGPVARDAGARRRAARGRRRRAVGVSGPPAPRRPSSVRRPRARSWRGSTRPGAASPRGGGPAQVVLLAGEAGIGKSRLAARFAAEAGAAGATVLYGACEEQSLVPYEPFSEAVGGEAPERDEIEARLTAAAAAGPLVLVLDDLHLADRNTLALLGPGRARRGRRRLLVLGAYRDADAVGTPLLAAIADLRRDCDVERVAVEGLSVDEVAALLDGAADARRDPRPDGREPVLRPRARAPPRRAPRRGRRRARERQRRRARTRRAALARERRGADGERRCWASRSTWPCSSSSDGPDDLLDALDEAAAAGLLEDGAGGRYRFAHALTRDAIYGGIGAEPARRPPSPGGGGARATSTGSSRARSSARSPLHLCDGARTGRPRRERSSSPSAPRRGRGERDAWEQVVTLLTRALALLDDADVERRRRLTRTRAIAYARLTHALCRRLER